MSQAAFSSRVLDKSRNALAAVDTDYVVTNKGVSLIYASALQMTGGQDILTTDAYSHAWYYEGGAGTFDVDRQTDVCNAVTDTVLVLNNILTFGNARCAADANSVEGFKEVVNTGGSSFAFPAIDVLSGQNAESQAGINVANVWDLDGRVVIMTMRTAIAIGGGDETSFLAKLRFPKPKTDFTSFPNPALAGGVGRR